MASSWIANFPESLPAAATQAQVQRRRRITHEAGHALEKLGHAIEYLTDEFVFEHQDCSPCNAQLAAVQILMSANRKIYFECPEIPTFGERLRALFGAHPTR